MKKKILAIDQGEHLGGAERFLAELLNRLPEHEIHLICSGNPEYLKLYKKNSVVIHELELPKLKPIRFQQFIRYRKAQAQLQKVIAHVKPDLILSNTVRTHLLISPLAKGFRIPLIWMAHDKTFPSSLLKWFLKYPRMVVSCSKYIEKFYKSHTKRTDLIFEVLYPFGVEPEIIKKLKKIKKQKTVGMVGKFIPWKNQLTFLQAVKDLEKLYPEYRFAIIGSPYEGNPESEAYFQQCSDFVLHNQLQKRISLKKSVPNILKALAGCDILVHCSSEPEPLGRVVLEGMAAGCAVIASPYGGPSEVIQHRQTGVLCKPDLATLKKELMDLLKDREERDRLGKLAQAKAEDEYAWEKVVLQFNNILRFSSE
ncbi:MAG: glycosyltransferase family 4 protein [Candidatus Altimarinota bacterium]